MTRVFAVLLVAILWQPAFAGDCSYPAPPNAIPDGKTAAQADMVAAMTTFKQYNADVSAYLACLELETAEKVRSAGKVASVAVQVKQLQAKKHNAALNEQKSLTGKFNEQVLAFKARK
ncbi:MAG TPA: hypothetical protein VK629_14945 [Steroidobacteraceae bacterium]|nr:hypothetical protein [Steroidobacteraceae bacterium]